MDSKRKFADVCIIDGCDTVETKQTVVEGSRKTYRDFIYVRLQLA